VSCPVIVAKYVIYCLFTFDLFRKFYSPVQQLKCSQEVWPPRSADTVSPRPSLMPQVDLRHFVSRIKKRQRWDVQTMWACDLDL